MKRAISILIAFVIAMSSALTSFAVYAEEEKESKGINNFIDGIVKLTHEYDKGKEFVTPEEDETAQIQAFSAQNSEEVTDSTETEYTLQDFQTARLIIRADGNFDKCGALEDVSGFEDFHILQYESPEAAMEAYINLKAEKMRKALHRMKLWLRCRAKKLKPSLQVNLKKKITFATGA